MKLYWISALKYKFFQSGLIGCFLYFGQFRNFCDFGLEADYSKDEELKKRFICVKL